MAKYTIDLANRFQSAFGFTAKNALGLSNSESYQVKPNSLGDKKSNSGLYNNINLFDDQSEQFETFKLIQSGTEEGAILNFGAFPFIDGKDAVKDWFAPPPILSFSRGKNIKTTAINGSDGEVIESYGLKSWDIKMQGLIIDMNKHYYPADKLKKISQVFELGAQFKVESPIFAELGITCLYFTNLSGLSGVEGYEDTWKYSLSAKSIKPIEFSLKEKK